MRFLVQRVTQASVTVDDQVIGQIEKGFLVFVGISETDSEEIAEFLRMRPGKRIWI